MPMQIRAARRTDLAALAQLHGQCFAHGWPQETFAASLSGDVLLVAEQSQGHGGQHLVGQHLVGLALARPALDEAEILTIAMARPVRGQGLGTRLLAALCSELAARTITRLFLEVAADNAPALALYARAGFVQIGLRRGYYAQPPSGPAPNGPAIDALVLARDLP